MLVNLKLGTSNLLCPGFEHLKLPHEVVLLDAEGTLEEAGEEREQSARTAAVGQFGKAEEVEHQWRGEQRIAALPGELQRHRRAEKATEVDMIPGGFPISEAGDVLDRDQRLRRIAEDLMEQAILAADLGGLISWVIEHLGIHV